MDTIWRNAAKKMRAREERAASRITTTTTVENPPAAFDPETGTLEELEQTSQRLQRDWPKEDGIPFPPDMLETLRALRAAVIARDARKRHTTAETPEQPASAESVEAAVETTSKKAEKKRRLREKRAAARTTALPTIVENPPVTIAIVSNIPITADYSPNPIGAVITATTPKLGTIASAPPNASPYAYTTTRPEQLYSLLAAPTSATINGTADLWEIAPNPADYSLNDIEEIVRKIRKRHEKTRAPVPESVQETADALRRAVQARDAAVSTQTATDPIAHFNSDTTVPTPTPTSAPVPTPALPPPAETSTPSSTPIGSDTAAPAPAPTHYETTTTRPPDREIEARQVAITTAPGPVKSQDREELEEERRESGEEREDEKQQTREENKRGTEKEERKDDEGIEEKVRDEKPTAPVRTVDGSACEPQRFDWATEIDESIGPVPSVSDFRPTTPPQLVHTPPAPTDCTPAAYTPAAPALIDPDPGDVAPHARTLATRLLTDNPVPVDPDPGNTTPNPVGVTLAKTEPTKLMPVDPVPAAPTPATRVPTEPQVRTPLIVHGPRDLSALRSGTSNPWGSIKRRRHCLHPLRDFSSLRSGTSNPWSNLRYRNRRSYPLHRHNTHSQTDPVRYSHLYPHHPEKSQPLRNSSSYLHPLPPQLNSRSQTHLQAQPQPPVHIFQIIQHPHGISPAKPKITKTIPTTTTKTPKNIHTTRCACGNTIPAYGRDPSSRRSMDTRNRRFRRRSRRFWIANEGVRYLGGGHLW